MNALLQALVMMSALGGPGDPKVQEPARCRVTLLAEPLDDLERRIGRIADDEAEEESEEKDRKQDETTRQRPDLPGAQLTPKDNPILDFEWMEIQPRVGMAIFSKNFHVNPSPAFGVAVRAPIKWLAPSSNPDGDYFGMFVQLDIAIIKRTIFPVLDKPSGPIFMGSFGFDYTIYRSENWLLMVEGGIQYCHYGGITDMKNGIAPMAGFKIGFSLTRSVSLSFNPEYIRGDGDSIILAWIAATVDF